MEFMKAKCYRVRFPRKYKLKQEEKGGGGVITISPVFCSVQWAAATQGELCLSSVFFLPPGPKNGCEKLGYTFPSLAFRRTFFCLFSFFLPKKSIIGPSKMIVYAHTSMLGKFEEI